MKRTTLKEQVANVIIAAASEATANVRSKQNRTINKHPDLTDEMIMPLVKVAQTTRASDDASLSKALVKILHVITKDDRFTVDKNDNILEPFCVIKFTYAGQFEPVIQLVTNAKKNYVFDTSGSESEIDGTWTVATDEEVVRCIATFTDSQWKSVMSVDLFAPLVKQALEEEITLVSDGDGE